MFTPSVFDRLIGTVDFCPFASVAGRSGHGQRPLWKTKGEPLYSDDERKRRNESAWTVVQGVLAPVQFLVFLISFGLVLHFMSTGEGLAAATVSIVIKTLVLYTIMITGAIWEKVVFGRYLFAPAFFWEDVFSILVLALHTAYLVALFSGAPVREQILIALAAYTTYVVNATQFVLKLRAARRGQAMAGAEGAALGTSQ